jgi:hypothetical protein
MSTVHGRRTDARLLTAWDEELGATALPPAERLDRYPIDGQVPATPGIERNQTAVLMRHLVRHRVDPLLERLVDGLPPAHGHDRQSTLPGLIIPSGSKTDLMLCCRA